MEIANLKIGKIQVTILADKKSELYVNESMDIKKVDTDYLLHQIALLKQANKKGNFTITLKAISKNDANKLNRNDIDFINENYQKIPSGGIYTMLKNKGF